MKRKIALMSLIVGFAVSVLTAQGKEFFKEDFEGKANKKLKTDKACSVEFNEGSKRLLMAPSDDGDAKAVFQEDLPAADYTVSFKVKFNSPLTGRSVRLAVRANEKLKDCILVSIKDNGSASVGLKVDGSSNGQPSESGKCVVDDKYHTVKVVVEGTKTTLFYDDKKTVEFSDATFKDAGRVALIVDKKSGPTYFDDFVITMK
jgi:hypothetical protein